ncbi:MAG: Saccharopine dehydrogenase [NADP, L-glutamate-forming] [Candidatus Ozemobacter sibiricus]|jgi:saccharopine dehydrogenase-like NADP-dependent oxidoreductase|uniref:Saccharopine dehydrogenase [NADP, L-glutamate-forming] n=1 Tax=Candidatus Ozemobacter sibiricus TaxID=2268124 RepID=A0A367ZMN7_9BACT|nr:MAG: Saccharopine dehydrogenase [NADP, L-glutamate-forming] [Candidatus Ozemobacter sibiricus]
MTHRLLVLGAGLVARPLVRYLLETTPHRLTCADREPDKARALIAGHPRGTALAIDVEDRAELSRLIAGCDLAVSLLPYTFHPTVAQLCLEHRKHLVTTSYVSPAMKAFDQAAQEAGVLFLNEIGLDPGLDHMSAMRVIDRVTRQGGQVVSFRSYCGGLPAPDANDNCMGYKFSWSPRGVLLAGRNHARYLEDGQVVEIPGPELFKHHWYVNIPGYWTFEAYPNRDSLPYRDLYGLQQARTMFRGTLRNPGWCRFWYKMARLGWLDDTPRADLAGKTWAQVLRALVPGQGALLDDLCRHWDVPADADEIKRIKWLGLAGDEPVPAGPNNLLDLLCAHLIKKLELKEGERDMIVLFHEFEAEYPGRREYITSTLVDFGMPRGDSAMSRTVSLPAAIAVRRILAGELRLTGVQIPVRPEIYLPVLAELETQQIKCVEAFHPR